MSESTSDTASEPINAPELPTAFDMVKFEHYLVEGQRLSDTNVKDCVRVVKKLITGNGIVHKNKPGESFYEGHHVTPADDLQALKDEANAWLPHLKSLGEKCLDKGHG